MGLADEKILTDLKYMMKKEYGRQRLRGFKKKIGKNLGIFHTYFDWGVYKNESPLKRYNTTGRYN